MNYRQRRLLILMMLIAIALMLIFGCTGYYCDPEPALTITANRIIAVLMDPKNKASPPKIRLVFIRPDNPRDMAIFEAGRKRGIEECMNERETQ